MSCTCCRAAASWPPAVLSWPKSSSTRAMRPTATTKARRPHRTSPSWPTRSRIRWRKASPDGRWLTRSHRRIWIGAVAVLVAAVALGGILVARRGDNDRPEADAHDVPATAPLAIADDPAPYRIVYLVEDLGQTTAV